MSEEKNKPEHKVKVGCVSATVWKNTIKKNGNEIEVRSITIEKNYKDGENWKTTSSFNTNDLQKVIMCATEAFSLINKKVESNE